MAFGVEGLQLDIFAEHELGHSLMLPSDTETAGGSRQNGEEPDYALGGMGIVCMRSEGRGGFEKTRPRDENEQSQTQEINRFG